MATFPVPYVPANPSSWGPPSEADKDPKNQSPRSKFHLLPYAPFGRSDRLGRAADFASTYYGNMQQRNQRDRRRFGQTDDGKNQEFQYKVEGDDFELVDTSKSTSAVKRFVAPAAKRRQQQTRLRQLNARRGNQNDATVRPANQQLQRTRRGRNTPAGGRGRGGPGGRGGGRGANWRERVDRQASVSVRPDWRRVDEFDISKLAKGVTDTSLPRKEEDLLWCGFLDHYNDAYDKCSARVPAPVKRSENKEFYPVTTMDDPVIEKLAIEGAGNVFATDAILAHLMTCHRSVYPWDIVVQKLPGSGALFFDKRDSSQFDYLTVNETANIPPSKTDDDPEGINTPERLSLEATMINQNFSQQILKGAKSRKEFDLSNPFFDENDNDGMEPASVAFRYRKFDLGDGVQLVCRTELHGIVKKKLPGSTALEEQYMTAFALNEFDSSKTPMGINWRDKIDSQRGAVLANELKNNAFKLAKWTAQSILADAQQMKIGFVSRLSPKNAYEHQILATQFYRPKDFATQITLSEGSMWGTLRMLIGWFKGHPEGKYVLMRDPNKAVLRVLAVPPGTFEDDDGENNEEEEDGEEGDKSEE